MSLGFRSINMTLDVTTQYTTELSSSSHGEIVLHNLNKIRTIRIK